ncbi:MAG: NADH-quinone oxidoreductase subunit NuoE [Bacteroidales bacterium]|nr:NADH-quinone oxidoreductase subunit NuoE [Bacteroidales bacterium]MCF8399674.1 NADH-quinone oxidoreductase subunit NuoE [Bacteroidales bacterium]
MERAVENILGRYPNAKRENLIPILQEIQEREGYLSEGAIVKVGQRLKLPASKIFGVATFYNQFRFEPLGKYHIQVCRGTACHVLGSASVLEEIEKQLNVKAGKTTKDGLFSIEVVACIGACGLAPVISVNGEFHAKVTTDSIKEILDEYRNKAEEGEGHE